jgi:hypothetical protein
MGIPTISTFFNQSIALDSVQIVPRLDYIIKLNIFNIFISEWSQYILTSYGTKKANHYFEILSTFIEIIKSDKVMSQILWTDYWTFGNHLWGILNRLLHKCGDITPFFI